MPGTHDWKKFDDDIQEVATALGIAGVGLQEEVPIDIVKALPDPDDMASHPTQEEVPIDIAKALPDPDDMASHPTKESHNPLDIPFGHEVDTKEINKNVKDNDDVEEGGLGSGRNPEGSGNGGGAQPGPLISFGETLFKEMVDSKISSCQCSKKN